MAQAEVSELALCTQGTQRSDPGTAMAADDGLAVPIDRERAIGFLREMVRVGKDGENAVQALVSKE